MERHFACTACGQCCVGWLPLTLDDALAHAGRFPLAMIWTPVRQGSKSFALTAKLGTTIRLRDRRQIAVGIVPTAYIPPAFSCPALAPDNLCAIHADKPIRCRTMPFFPYREETDQAELLIPRKGWMCDVSAAAAVAYRDKVIVERADFDAERAALLRQAVSLRAYADQILASVPRVADMLVQVAMKPLGGHLVLDFATVLPRLGDLDTAAFARKQFPVLTDFAARTADIPALAEYHQHYRAWAGEMERLAAKPS